MISSTHLRQISLSSLALGLAGMLISCTQGVAPTAASASSDEPVAAAAAAANTINWAGHTWNVTTGGMAGGNTGSASNVFVDASGYLHLKITKSGSTWTCAELFTTDNLGFGTYQWQVEGPIDKLDKNIVLGFYPYGPARGIGSDGHNEIDIEYARWGNSAWANGNWTIFPASGSTVGSTTFNFSLSGTYTTSRFIWNSTNIKFWLLGGFQPVGSTTNTIQSWTYAPSNSSTNIPQQALPLGVNLWLYNHLAPSNGQPVEIIVHSFTRA